MLKEPLLISFTAAAIYLSSLVVSPNTSIEAVITSGNRTTQRQAELIVDMCRSKVNLLTYYSDKALAKELSVPCKKLDIEGVKTVIESNIKKGKYISKHLCGKAWDLRKKGENINVLLDILKKTKGVKILEDNTHYHIETKDKC